METGIVRYFNESKGYGFIQKENSARDIFVHVNSFLEEIREEDEVEFELVEGKKGVSAINVRRIA
jgi:CspA family cold shock protein